MTKTKTKTKAVTMTVYSVNSTMNEYQQRVLSEVEDNRFRGQKKPAQKHHNTDGVYLHTDQVQNKVPVWVWYRQ